MEAVQLSVDQNGSLIVELETDQRLDINLEGNPTTGYTWEIMNIDKRILLQESEKFKPESDLEGSPGLFVFRLMAVEKGQTDIVLIYHRPWEKEVEPLSTFFIKVIVR
jgi:inhibitor of cysteine peptidase